MKDILEQTVYYADTDSYGVVWHGTYLRWMEQARVEFCRKLGIDLVSMKENNVIIPVTNINIRYKASAKLDEVVIIESEITQMSRVSITFTQTVKNRDTKRVYTIAEVQVVCVNSEGKIYREMPDILKSACEKAMSVEEL